MMILITVLFWTGVISYLGAAPDKYTLAGTRGLAGAVKGFNRARGRASGNRKKGGRGRPAGASKAASSSSEAPVASSPWRGALAGWHDGIQAARDRRSKGQDLWSRGTWLAGRIYGGGESMVVGVGGIRPRLAAWRNKRHANAAGAEGDSSAEETQTSDDAEQPRREQPRREQPRRESKRPADADLWAGVIADEADRLEAWTGRPVGSGLHTQTLPTANLLVAGDKYRQALQELGEPLPELGVWNLIAHARARLGRTSRLTSDVTVTQVEDDPSASAAQPAEGGAPSEGEGAPITTIAGVLLAGSTKENNMGMRVTELSNPDEVEAEVVEVEAALEAVVIGLRELSEWATHLPERWAGTEWSTAGLDAAIAGVPESFQILIQADTALEQFAVVRSEIGKARAAGEQLAEVGATGRVEGFQPG